MTPTGSQSPAVLTESLRRGRPRISVVGEHGAWPHEDTVVEPCGLVDEDVVLHLALSPEAGPRADVCTAADGTADPDLGILPDLGEMPDRRTLPQVSAGVDVRTLHDPRFRKLFIYHAMSIVDN